MSYISPQNQSQRFTGISIVVVLHIVLVYALMHGLARKIVEVVQPPLETTIIEEIKPPEPEKLPPPPQTPPKLAAPPPPFVPVPEVRVDTPPVQNTITAVTPVKPAVEAVPAPVAAPGPARTAAVIDARNCDKPEYPPASLRAEETGLVVLEFLVDTDGRALESKVERSSGSRRLDEAARRALGLCKFKPGTENGRPVQSWARIEYLWKLDD